MKANDEEKPPVRLKGLGNSLCVTIDPSHPSTQLKTELDKVFKNLRHLAKDARVLLDLGRDTGHGGLIKDLEKFLKKNYGVGSVQEPKKRNLSPDPQKSRPTGPMPWSGQDTDMLLLSGRVRSGQKVSARKHLVILGDVNPGAEVLAGGDIVVLGSLCGTAIAGQPENEDAIILALDFRPTQVQIGAIVAAGLPLSPRPRPEFACIEEDTIVVEDYLEANPFKALPWPQVR